MKTELRRLMKRPSMSPSENKKKRRTERKNKPSSLNQGRQSLPDDLLLSCFARVSRLYYPVLSLAHKSFRSLLTSQELYQTRASLGQTDKSLYVCLRFPSDSNTRWFTLGRIHGHHKLFPIPIPDSPPLHSSSLIVYGSDIYNIDGSSNGTPSSSVWILDCRSHTWHEAPSMLVKRMSPSIRVLDGKIYVRGGHKEYISSSSPWMEVFDPKTQTWDTVSENAAEFLSTGPIGQKELIRLKFIDTRSSYGYVRYELVLNPTVYTWNTEFVRSSREFGWGFSCYCLIDDVIYSYGDGLFKWYDTNDSKIKRHCWTNLEGVPKIAKSSFVKLMNYGGKIAVLWDKFVPSSGYEKNRVIHCAVVSLERRNNEEIYGSVDWCDAVLTVPESCEFVNALVATV